MKSLHRLALQCAGATDTGQVRSNNEDALVWHAGAGLAVLADGMGGYNAGEVAAALAVDGIGGDMLAWRREYPQACAKEAEQALRDAVTAANQAILHRATSDAQCAGMGTTLVAAVFCDDALLLCHAGDARCYRLRAGVLEQLTRDHSWVQEQVDAGWLSADEARHYGPRNLVTRALGVQGCAGEQYQQLALCRDDLYLLSSDGLHDLVDDAELLAALTHASALQAKAQRLVDLANVHGGSDNISVMLVQLGGASSDVNLAELNAPLQRLP